MKILIVHNDYGRYSGEEAVVDKLAAMFGRQGHTVSFYRLTTAGSRGTAWGNVRGFVCGMYAPGGVRGMREALRRERPDVVNVHNLYPFISPAALFACKAAGVPVVMTVHNYRLMCPTGLFMRGGRPCELCLQRGHEWGCVWHNCERSPLKSVGYALRNLTARLTGAYTRNVNTFVCLTDFQRKKLVAAGYEAERITVIPNAVEAPARYAATAGNYVAYIGRLSYEKGYDLLLEVARRHPEIPFRLAGARRDGAAMDVPANVRLAGYLDKEGLEAFIREARLVVMPSRCYEGFPMAILEAACAGKPCIGPAHGGFTEIIGTGEAAIGRLFRPNDTDDLEAQVTDLWNDPARAAELGRRAFSKLHRLYTDERVCAQWDAVFDRLRKRGGEYVG